MGGYDDRNKRMFSFYLMWNRSFCQSLRKGFTLLHACGTQKHRMPCLMHASYFQYCSMAFTIHCPENNIWFNLSIWIPSISNRTNSSVPLNFFTHKYLHWVHGSTQPLKSSWRSWSINIKKNCSIFMQIPHSDLPLGHHDFSEALHSYTANRMMVHAIKMQDRNVYLPNNHQLVG